MKKKVSLHPISNYYQISISRKQKSDIIIIIIIIINILWDDPNLFLDLKPYNSLEHAETKKYIFYLDIYIVK